MTHRAHAPLTLPSLALAALALAAPAFAVLALAAPAFAVLALAAPALPARAMVAVSLFRAPLRAAAQAAAACPDVVDGRYVVRVDIGTDGRSRGAQLLDSPRITLLAEECIERAFASQAYPAVGPGPHSQEHIYMSFPFVVSGRPAP